MLQRTLDAAQAFVDYAARCSHVHAHESFAFGSEHGSVVERQFGFLDKEAVKMLVVKPEPAAVEPYQE